MPGPASTRQFLVRAVRLGHAKSGERFSKLGVVDPAPPIFTIFQKNVKLFRMNTLESVSKQRTLTSCRMNICEKPGGEGYLLLLTSLRRGHIPDVSNRNHSLR